MTGSVLLLGCSTVNLVGNKESACLITYEEMIAAKSQLGKQEVELTLAGNTFSIYAGFIQGFNGDFAYDYTVEYEPACKIDDELTKKYQVTDISVITFVWSSWKNEHVDVYPNKSLPPDGYFNPPIEYLIQK
ncbi:hypothetical protein [Litorimonas sp. WD9-15]|uniref:hypothetical protein n=1 Tax=Litorimonas sp. WD9-15 TaxID=3418716 RepID=UPI003CFE3071